MVTKKQKGSWAIWGDKCQVCSFTTSEEVCPRCGTPMAVKNKTLVIEDAGLRGGFSQIPNAILRNPLLSANAVRLYCLLLSHAWQDNECFPGQDRLAGYLGCSRQHVNTILQELRRHKLIDWKRTGRSSLYRIKKLTGYLGGEL